MNGHIHYDYGMSKKEQIPADNKCNLGSYRKTSIIFFRLAGIYNAVVESNEFVIRNREYPS